jgi:hypothetical protein
LLGVTGLYGLWILYSTQKRRVRLHTIFSVLVTGSVIVTLIGLNIYQTGHMSGAPRSAGGGLGSVPIHAAHLGWAFIGILSSPEIARFIGGVESPIGIIIGYTVLGIVFVHSFWSDISSRFDQQL